MVDATSENDLVIDTPVDEWLDSVEFTTTKDVPVPENIVDQVIGQEEASIVVKKAAEQRRHVMMIGDPGTGKSMLARAMTELLPPDELEDVLCYPNEDDENEPRVRAVPAGRGDRIVKQLREQVKIQRDKTNRTLLIAVVLIGFVLAVAAIQSGQIITLIFGMLLLGFGYMFIRSRLTSRDENKIQ